MSSLFRLSMGGCCPSKSPRTAEPIITSVVGLPPGGAPRCVVDPPIHPSYMTSRASTVGVSAPQRRVRELLGLSVHTLSTTFPELCARLDCHVYEERQYGTGEFAGTRRPTCHDIKQPVLLDHTAGHPCTRDGQPGAALVDVLEDLGGQGSVGRAQLMLS